MADHLSVITVLIRLVERHVILVDENDHLLAKVLIQQL